MSWPVGRFWVEGYTRYFSALWARMYRFSANSRATISSTAIFLSQQSRQYFSSPRGSETSFALQRAHRTLETERRDIRPLSHGRTPRSHPGGSLGQTGLERRQVHP